MAIRLSWPQCRRPTAPRMQAPTVDLTRRFRTISEYVPPHFIARPSPVLEPLLEDAARRGEHTVLLLLHGVEDPAAVHDAREGADGRARRRRGLRCFWLGWFRSGAFARRLLGLSGRGGSSRILGVQCIPDNIGQQAASRRGFFRGSNSIPENFKHV